MKRNYYLMLDMNGKPILEDSLLKHIRFTLDSRSEPTYQTTVSKMSRMHADHDRNNAIVLVFDGCRKNPCEVEVVTKEEAVLIAFEEDGVILDF